MASLSPLAIQGTKRSLLNSRDSESVEKRIRIRSFEKTRRSLISDDLKESMNARFEKRKPVYSRFVKIR